MLILIHLETRLGGENVMSKLVVVLADEDERYLMPLELKFIEEFDDRAEIIVITDKEYLKSFFSIPQKIDILIINEGLYGQELGKQNIGNVFLLMESNFETGTEELNIKRIYKYTSVKEIYNEIINNSSSKVLNPICQQDKTTVIMTYSPCGGVGKTTITIGIAAAIAKTNKRILYINTESLQSFNYLFKNKSYQSNDFEKQLISHDKHILHSLQSSLGKEGFDYILPFKQATCSLNIHMEDYRYLIEQIKTSRLYDYVIVDTSTEFNSEKTMLMSYCDHVIIITAQDRVSTVKLDALLNNIDCSDKNKFIFVCNKYNEEKPNYLLKDDIINKCLINEYIKVFDTEESNVDVDFLANNGHFQKLAYMFI